MSPRNIKESERKAKKDECNRKYREENREKEAARRKRYREDNLDKEAARQKRYREKNPENIAAASKKWREKNPENIAAANKKYREDNPEKEAARQKKYRLANPEQGRARVSKRRSRLLNAAGWSYATASHIAARWETFGGRCWMCGGGATAMDHVKPLAAGGSHFPSNQRPACRTCNSSKGAKWPYPKTAIISKQRAARTVKQ